MNMLRLSLVLALLFTPAVAFARGGGAPLLSGAEFDRVVQREIRAQDRLHRSALKQGRGLVGFVRRYKERARKEDAALAHFLLGRAYGLDTQDDLGIRHLTVAAEKRAGFHQAYFRLAVLYFRKKDFKRAESYLDRALAAKPDAMPYLDMKAKLLFARGDWPGTKRFAEKMLRLDSTNDEARALLGAAYMGLKQWQKAQQVFAALIQKNPRAIPLRAQWIDCALRLNQWEQAIVEIKALLAVAPRDPSLRRLLVQAYLGKGDAAAATGVLREMVKDDPKNWQVRRVLAEALLAADDPVGAKRELTVVLEQLAALPRSRGVDAARSNALQMRAFCSLAEARALLSKKEPGTQARVKGLMGRAVASLGEADGLAPLPPHMLDRLQVTLAQLGRHKERIPYLERMAASLKERSEEGKRLRDLIALLKSGGSEVIGEQESAESRLKDLIARCTGEDVKVRRVALHEYFDLNLPFVDPVIYQRHDHRVEADPDCRFWVVRILGRFQAGTASPEIVRIAARYAGLALEDPESAVRRGAAEALGSIGAPAGILYLLPHVSAMAIDVTPPTQAAGEDLEREYNAARGALIELTGRVDYKIGGERWVKLSGAVANRAAWRAWFDTPSGVAKRLEALEDLAAVTDVDPRWQLRYILVDVIQDTPPAPAPVALKAYQILRDRILALPAGRRAQDAWWSTFPVFEDRAVNDAGLAELREALRVWWPPKPSSMKAGSKKPASKKPGSKKPGSKKPGSKMAGGK